MPSVSKLGIAQPLVSHHLRVLRQAGLIHPEPAGSFTYYVLERPVLAAVAAALGDVAAAPPGGARRRPCG